MSGLAASILSAGTRISDRCSIEAIRSARESYGTGFDSGAFHASWSGDNCSPRNAQPERSAKAWNRLSQET